MNLGGPEILVIIVVALLVLGPDKLPSALRSIGRVMGQVKKYQDLAKTEINNAMSGSPSVLDNLGSDKPEKPSEKKTVVPTEDGPVAPILDEDD